MACDKLSEVDSLKGYVTTRCRECGVPVVYTPKEKIKVCNLVPDVDEFVPMCYRCVLLATTQTYYEGQVRDVTFFPNKVEK